MSYSLLAHLYPHIRGSQEDIATYSLQYLLSQSKALNIAFTKRIADIIHIKTEETLLYVCQATGKGEEKERPDMAGLNMEGKEEVLCEIKFYATLTANQPITYLDRLNDNGGKGLLFVCPAIRRTNLWAKLKELCSMRKIEEIDENCIMVDGISLGITTWNEIITLLKNVASSVAIELVSDIQQLEGYCNQIDNDAFIPFSAGDISAEMANKGERYYQVIDEVIELFCADKNHQTSKKGVKATGYRKGYTRSLYIDGMTFTLNYDRDMWKNPECVETPFWVAIRKGDWDQDDRMIEKHNVFPENRKQIFWGMIFLALEPKQNVTLAEVSEDIKNQIERYFEILK
ncbi:MAG: hypothetical protein IJD97_04835 [Clostridia bacterium]|nr:hypothetical protein [Clostridia bacterium]